MSNSTETSPLIEVGALYDLASRGDINTAQFCNAVGVVIGKRERSPQSEAVGRLINAVTEGTLPVSALVGAVESITDSPSLSLTVPDDAWRPVGGPEADRPTRLLAALTINGTPMHLEAYQVQNDLGTQVAVDDEDEDVDDDERSLYVDDDDLSLYAQATGADGPFVTTTIDGREYVLVATPHCD